MLHTAIIFVPAAIGLAAAQRWRDICAEHCQRRGYNVVAVVSAWEDAIQMMHDGVAVIVVGHRDHLPAHRRPRLEAVTDPQAAQSRSSQRRPQRRQRQM